jgi:hypothetical protein
MIRRSQDQPGLQPFSSAPFHLAAAGRRPATEPCLPIRSPNPSPAGCSSKPATATTWESIRAHARPGLVPPHPASMTTSRRGTAACRRPFDDLVAQDGSLL